MTLSDDAARGLEQAAHDLNNLLGAIVNYVTLIERGDHVPQTEADLAQIRDAAERAAVVVGEVRAIAQRTAEATGG